MNLLPEDLGEKRCRLVTAHRAGYTGPTKTSMGSVGFWGKLWLGRQQTQLSPEEAAAALQMVRRQIKACRVLGLLPTPIALAMVMLTLANPQSWGEGFPALFVSIGTLFCGWFFGFARPRTLVQRKVSQMYAHPVTPGEIAALLPQAHDELERAYLTLAMDVVRQEVAPTPQTGPASGVDLRLALQALGNAIDRLPATRVVGNLTMGSETPDIMTEVLRRTAAETLLSAQAEPDRVVAASLIRRVEALHRRADATARASVLVRRFSALRQEMAAETEALRASLAAYYTGAHEIADLTQLAADMERVAAEAAAMTAAVEEVDAAMLAAPLRPLPNEIPKTARIQLGQG